MKKTLLFLLSTFYIAALLAQDSTPIKPDTLAKTGKNVIYMELLGSALFYSINYENVLWAKDKKVITARIGLSHGDIYNKTIYELFAPITTSFLYGRNKSKLELGAGGLVHFNTHPYPRTRKERKNYVENGEAPAFSPPFEVFPIVVIGYRFQPKTKGIVFRTSFTPIVDRLFRYNYFVIEDKFPVFWWGGMSIGYIFK